MQLVDLSKHRDTLTEGARAELVAAIRELLEQAESGEIDGVVWVASGGDFIHQGHYNVETEFYRIIGGMDALKAYLLDYYHVRQFDESD